MEQKTTRSVLEWSRRLGSWYAQDPPDSERKVDIFVFRMFRLIGRFSKCDFWNLENILGLYRKNLSKNIFWTNRKKSWTKTKTIFFDFFRIRNADTLIRSYHIKHDFQLKFIDFPVIFKDNFETFLAETCLSFPECSEQFFGSLET